MPDTHSYLVPEYYKDFVCKCGDCRSTCCRGWEVTLTREDYFRMIGLDCPPDLRRKLDCAFYLTDFPTPDRYAMIGHGYDGNCRLLCDDGYCSIQRICGETALSAVCRYYPRSPKSEFEYECSCSNSCEKTIEMLFEIKNPMRFLECELSFNLEQTEPGKTNLYNKNTVRAYRDIRMACIGILQNRTFHFSDRISLLGKFIEELKIPAAAGDTVRIHDIISRYYGVKNIETENAANPDYVKVVSAGEKLLRHYIKVSPNMQFYGKSVLEYLGLNGESSEIRMLSAAAEYERLCTGFAENFENGADDYDLISEHIMINHLFYNQFPFSDHIGDFTASFASFRAAYTLTCFLNIVYTAGCEYTADKVKFKENFADVTAAAYRLIEHSDFDRNERTIRVF